MVVRTRAPAVAATDSVYVPVFIVEVVPMLSVDVADVELTETGFGVKVLSLRRAIRSGRARRRP